MIRVALVAAAIAGLVDLARPVDVTLTRCLVPVGAKDDGFDHLAWATRDASASDVLPGSCRPRRFRRQFGIATPLEDLDTSHDAGTTSPAIATDQRNPAADTRLQARNPPERR